MRDFYFPSISLYKKSNFVKQVLTLLGGSTISQAIPILISPILTRVYSPQDFGIYAFYLSIVSICSIITTCRYELAIMLPEHDYEAFHIVLLSIILSTIMCTVGLLIIFITNIFPFFSTTRLGGDWIWGIPVLCFLVSFLNTLNYWLNRKKAFSIIAKRSIWQSLIAAISSILFGMLLKNVHGLFISYFLSLAVPLPWLLKEFFRNWRKEIPTIDIKQIWHLAIKNYQFPLINTPHALVDSFQTTGIYGIISSFWGSVTLGLYSFTFKTLKVPTGLIGTSVGQAFFSKAVELKNAKYPLAPVAKKLFWRLLLLSFIPFTSILLGGSHIFKFVFGKNWEVAGSYAQILSPWFFLSFAVSPLSLIPIILNKQLQAFIFGLLYLLVFLGAFYVGYFLNYNFITILYFITLSGSIVLSLYTFWIFKISKEVDS